LFGELIGGASFFQVLIMHVKGGALPEPRLAQWVEGCFLSLAWPDSRLWPNHIAALAGTARVLPAGGICAGSLAADAAIYGPGTALPTARFIQEARFLADEGKSIEEIIATIGLVGDRLRAPGYMRPLARGDERVPFLQRLADRLGFEIGPHLELAYQIDDYLRERFDEGINLSGYCAAFLSDQSFTPDQMYRLFTLSVTAGVHACYAEYADEPPLSYLPLRCDDVEYTGPDPVASAE
jgi:citrate synthase